MKIFYLCDTSSIHSQKWVNYFLSKNYDITCISFSKNKIEGTKHINILEDEINIPYKKLWQKIFYLKRILFIRSFIKKEQPDILHAHYASSYGFLGALCNYKKFLISVWGSDVFEFPKINFLTKNILKYNLKKAQVICSTSKIMADEIKKYTNKNITITPFGVNTSFFYPKNKNKNNLFRIGTVKTLETIYGIDTLIKAFKLFSDKYENTILEIVGDGTKRSNYETLVKELNIQNKVIFRGKVKNEEVPNILNSFDIFVALSLQESFGVAVVESMSCSIPVVVSNISGLTEVVINNKTGIIVDVNSPEKACEAFEKLYNDNIFYSELSKNSRQHVLDNYDWKNNAKIMENIYINLKKS
ncbi:MAG: glycosyltransferase [Candidatus Sericytochromatia bacterium]